MGKIIQIKEDLLINGGSNVPIYPVTSAKAVYYKNGHHLQKEIDDMWEAINAGGGGTKVMISIPSDVTKEYTGESITIAGDYVGYTIAERTEGAPTNEGTYNYSAVLKTGCIWSDNTSTPKTVKLIINVTRADNPITVTGKSNLVYIKDTDLALCTTTLNGYDGTVYYSTTGKITDITAEGVTTTIPKGRNFKSDYKVWHYAPATLSYKAKSNDEPIVVSIAKKTLTKPSLTSNSKQYTGSAIDITANNNLQNFDSTYMEIVSGQSSIDVSSTLSLVIRLKDTTNTQWTGSTTDNVSLSWSITPIRIDVPTVSDLTFENTPKGHGLTTTTNYTVLSAPEGDATIKDTATDAGTYTVIVQTTTGRVWTGGAPYGEDSTKRAVTWKINPKSITKPTMGTFPTYNGATSYNAPYTAVDTTYVTVGGTTTLTEHSASNVNVTFDLKYNTSTLTNVKWSDNSTTQVSLAWNVNLGNNEIKNFSITSPNANNQFYAEDTVTINGSCTSGSLSYYVVRASGDTSIIVTSEKKYTLQADDIVNNKVTFKVVSPLIANKYSSQNTSTSITISESPMYFGLYTEEELLTNILEGHGKTSPTELVLSDFTGYTLYSSETNTNKLNVDLAGNNKFYGIIIAPKTKTLWTHYAYKDDKSASVTDVAHLYSGSVLDDYSGTSAITNCNIYTFNFDGINVGIFFNKV